MASKPYLVTYADNGAPRITGVVRWQHRAGPAHCLVRAAYEPTARQAAVVVSEVADNPDDRGITADFGKVADAVLPLLREVFPPELREVTWIAHFGEFSYHDPAGPESFTHVTLAWDGSRFVDDRQGDRKLGAAEVTDLLGGWRLDPVPQDLSRLGHEG